MEEPIYDPVSNPDEFDEDHDSVAWAIKDTGFNIDSIATQIAQTCTRDQVSQIINRLNKTLNQ